MTNYLGNCMLFHTDKHPTELKITHLNKEQLHYKQQLLVSIGDKKQLKKTLKKALFSKHKSTKEENKVYVLDFHGDIKATAVQQLREEINALLTIAKQGDEVVIRLESSGGLVHAYGLASSQLARIKEAGLKLTICIDKVAASGGYMMACVADKILSAPFAVVGSIGVVAQVPNFHEFLEKHNVDVDVFTAGKYKRTVTMFGKNEEENKQKFQQELEQTHQLFQEFVTKYRPQLELEKVATGEHWYGTDALNLKLVDELKTSDSYILELMKNHEVYAIHTRKKPTLAEKLGLAQTAQTVVSSVIDIAVSKAMEKLPEVMASLDNEQKMMIKK